MRTKSARKPLAKSGNDRAVGTGGHIGTDSMVNTGYSALLFTEKFYVESSRIFGNRSRTGSIPVMDQCNAVTVTPHQLYGISAPAFSANLLKDSQAIFPSPGTMKSPFCAKDFVVLPPILQWVEPSM